MIEKGLVYRIDEWSGGRRLCVPKDCIKEILDIAHDNGHPEYTRTFDIVTKS